MARNTKPMSRALPGTLRKRTSEKAPATAMPAPTLPSTRAMTTQTIAGSTARVHASERVERPRAQWQKARPTPSARAHRMQTAREARSDASSARSA